MKLVIVMRKKDLEIILQKLPPHPAPVIKLEQYTTPAIIAADIVFNAYIEEEIADKVVLDLGCGTGSFALAAALLSAEQVIGVDVDGTALAIAEGYAEALSLDITFLEQDLTKLTSSMLPTKDIDTVIQNPPFGAQKSARGADRVFLEKALKFAKIIYSLHLSKTDEFITLLIEKLGGQVIWKKKYVFPIEHIYHFHSQEKVSYEVTLFKIKG
jgi:putative methylase